MKKVLSILGILLLVAILGGCIYLDSLMPIITGYGAKTWPQPYLCPAAMRPT